jgi:hypothetical protein
MSWFTSGGADGYGSNAEHLRDELHRAAGFVRAQLLRFKAASPEAQRERFWHLPDEQLDAAAGDDEGSPLAAFDPTDEIAGILDWVAKRRADIDRRIAATKKVDLRLAQLGREFGLTGSERDALLLALLPSVHSAYRRWYGLLQGDAARVLPGAGLLVEMLAAGADGYPPIFRELSSSGRLARERLIALLGGEDDPAAIRPVAVEDRVTAFVFGEAFAERRLSGIARWFDEPVDVRSLPIAPDVANRLEMLPNLRAAEPAFLEQLRLEFLGPDPGLAVRTFAVLAAGIGRRVLAVDIDAALAGGTAWPLVVDCVLREVRLGAGVPIFTGVARLFEQPDQAARAEYLLARLSALPHPAAIAGGAGAGEEPRALPGWIPFRLGTPTVARREALWARLVGAGAPRLPDAAAVARTLAAAFQLTDSQIRDAWRMAESLARRRNVFTATIEPVDLFEACRRQSSTRLVAFAQRIEPRPDLQLDRDLILPPASKRPLFELRARIRNHPRVHGVMGLGEHMRLGRGVTALFVGGSGTGKTMAAEVLASEQQVDLYRIDLAALTSKWVGETEKNLSRVFADAERANCMLFFDEADAMFGHRGDIKEAHDRWANLEVNYLLQRIEEYSGVVVLATNLRQNIDEAFQRRIHVVIEFPLPDAESRRRIWDRLLPASSRNTVGEQELLEIAQRFELTGGNIRNVVLDACYRALEQDATIVTVRHLVASAAREYQKLSRPVTRGDFGRFYEWAMEDVIAPAAPDGRPAAAEA